MYTKNLAIALSTLALFASVTLYAKTPKQAEVPPCSTSVECDVMAKDLQGKIDVLEAKGLENLTDDEFTKLDTLQDKLIAVSKVRTAQGKAKLAQAKAKLAQAKAKLAQAKAKTAQAKAKNAAMLKAQNKELAEMKKIFKEKTK